LPVVVYIRFKFRRDSFCIPWELFSLWTWLHYYGSSALQATETD
jgi:hypothetical protein